jgi:hypothetical protein
MSIGWLVTGGSWRCTLWLMRSCLFMIVSGLDNWLFIVINPFSIAPLLFINGSAHLHCYHGIVSYIIVFCSSTIFTFKHIKQSVSHHSFLCISSKIIRIWLYLAKPFFFFFYWYLLLTYKNQSIPYHSQSNILQFRYRLSFVCFVSLWHLNEIDERGNVPSLKSK